MERLIASLGLSLAAFSLSACSLVVNTDPYVGGGESDSGPTRDAGTDPADDGGGGDRDSGSPPADGGGDGDGGTVGSDGGDAMVPVEVPTTPVVEITPAAPVTTDELSAAITTESTDPLDAGAITYEWVWLTDGSDSGETGQVIGSDLTAKGELWRVEVTPVGADGRRGDPGVAEVTIQNSPPTVEWVRLSHYRPVVGDTIVATAGPRSDPDGDAVGLTYAWFLDGTELSGQTSNRLDTSGLLVEPGAQIHVEVTSFDSDEDGNTVEAGPAIALADVTRWRQLLPNRTWELPHLVTYDPRNDRVLMIYASNDSFQGIRVWEYDLQDGHFTQLFPTGPSPKLVFARPIWDSVNERVLIVGGQGDFDGGTFTSDVYVLDVSRRGAEAFSVISPAGAVPEPRYFANVAFDEEREQLLLYAGIQLETGNAFDDLWTLDVSVVGGETWTEHSVPLPPVTLLGSGFVVDAERDRALLISGGEYSGGAGEPPTSDELYSLDLTNLSTGFLQEATVIPSGRFFATTGVDRVNDRVILAYGAAPEDTFHRDWVTLDLETLDAQVVDPSGDDAIRGGGNGFLVERGDGLLLYPGTPFFDATAALDLFAIDPATDQVSPIHLTGVDQPPGLREALGAGESRLTIFGGEDHRGEIREDVWRFAGTGGFSRVMVQPDELDGSTPGPRAGISMQSSSPWSWDIQFFGGRTAGGGLADASGWLLRSDRWVRQTAGEGFPEARSGHSIFHHSCGGGAYGFFGGVDATGTVSRETGHLDCFGERSCTWSDPTEGAEVLVPARSHATTTLIAELSYAVLFGGRDGSRNPIDSNVWLHYVCGGGAQGWTQPANVTAPEGLPPARWGHTTLLISDYTGGGSLDRLLVFGGSGGSYGPPLDDAHILTVVTSADVRWAPVPVASGPIDDRIPGRYNHVAIWDSNAERVLVYGGEARGEVLSDLWELRYRPPGP